MSPSDPQFLRAEIQPAIPKLELTAAHWYMYLRNLTSLPAPATLLPWELSSHNDAVRLCCLLSFTDNWQLPTDFLEVYVLPYL